MAAACPALFWASSRAQRAPGRQPPPRGTEQSPGSSSMVVGSGENDWVVAGRSGRAVGRSSRRNRSIDRKGRASEATLVITGVQIERKGIAATLAGKFD